MKRSLFLVLLLILCSCVNQQNTSKQKFTNDQFKTLDCPVGMPINATFLDEVSWDIPHQNWGVEEWDQDFRAMRDMGINTVVLKIGRAHV